MFASNQILEISGDLDVKSIRIALDVALKLGLSSDFDYEHLLYQRVGTKCICVGYCSGDVPDGWNRFEFASEGVVVGSLISFLSKHPVCEDEYAGTYRQGFLMCRKIRRELDALGVKDPVWSLVTFEPFTTFYAKCGILLCLMFCRILVGPISLRSRMLRIRL